MAAVPDGQRTLDWFWKANLEQGAGGVGLHLPATGTKAVEMDRTSLDSTDYDRLDWRHFDSGRIVAATCQQSADLAEIPGTLQVTAGQEGRAAEPATRSPEDACATGEVDRLAEAFKREPPFLARPRVGLGTFCWLRCQP